MYIMLNFLHIHVRLGCIDFYKRMVNLGLVPEHDVRLFRYEKFMRVKQPRII